MSDDADHDDTAALAETGARVKDRLEANPAVGRVPASRAEIYALAEFLDPDECAALVAMIDAVATPSTLFESVARPQYRTSYSGNFDREHPLVRSVERRICDLLGIDEAWGETMQGQRYEPGQEYRKHYDWFNTDSDYWPGEVLRGGQRSWTAMIFLANVEEGGATEFTELKLRIPPQAGALLTWNNCLPDGRPNPDTMHAALPVVSGVKYVLTKWFRTRPWK